MRSFESKILCLPTSGLWKEMRYCNHQLEFKKEICGYVWCFHLLYLFAILCKPHKIRDKQNWKAMQVQIIRWITNLNINYQSNKLIMHINKLKSSYIFAQRFLKLKIQTEKITKKNCTIISSHYNDLTTAARQPRLAINLNLTFLLDDYK